MPVIEMHLIEGYSADDKTRLCEVLTDACRLVIPAPVDGVTVMIHDHAPTGYMRGRAAKTPAPALPDPASLVRSYLMAMEARDLGLAQTMLADTFTMQFPGTDRMETLDQLIEWSRPRYNRVAKTYERFDTAATPEGHAVVYCFGTLHGEWPDGRPFEGIRFVDRFEVENGRIARQDVWNDMGEVRS